LVSIKRTKIVATRHVSWAQNIPKCVSTPDLTCNLAVLPDSLAGFKGHFTAGRRGQEEKGRRGVDGSEKG